ncbi:MAG: polysaccharide biosynthesis protein [Firmicutes bacterium]|nr:polysaccharide biosynthesis protein [Bacillota bacterium]
MLIDAGMINLSVYCALLLRFEGNIPQPFFSSFLHLSPVITVITVAFLFALKLYNRIWEYASVGELTSIIRSVTYSMASFVLAIYVFRLATLPRSVYILSWLLITVMIGVSRLWWRLFRDFWFKHKNKDTHRVLIVGAGDAGAILSKEIINSTQLRMELIGFIDDDPRKQKMMLNQVPILGTRADIPRIIEEFDVQEVIIAMPSVSGSIVKEIVSICKKTVVKLRILPGVYQSTNGNGVLSKIRDIHMEDLLRRDPVEIDLTEIAGYLEDKTVLITGAGGSIGSELCRQVCGFYPRMLVMVDNSENNLYEIEMEISGSHPETDIVPCLVDVRNLEKVKNLFRQYRPQVVFHAAAYKHVPMMERYPEEAFQNNVIGTKNVAETSFDSKVDTFILISTDKAVNPTSVMGATKRLAEVIIQNLNKAGSTRFAAVRFGNVLGSRGSVVPIFQKQIEAGGPLTVTDPSMQRYFMTISEAVQLIIQAGALTEGGEIFVLDMGNPIKILDLAEDLIRLSGYRPGDDIEIIFTGKRPGEKLNEELFTAPERMITTKHERILIANESNGNGSFSSLNQIISDESYLSNDKAVELFDRLLSKEGYWKTHAG